MVEWHHWLDGHEFEQTLGDSEGQTMKETMKDWRAAVHGVAKSLIQLSDWTELRLKQVKTGLLERQTRIWILAPSFTGCVTLEKSLNLSQLQCFHLQNGYTNSISLTEKTWEFNDIMFENASNQRNLNRIYFVYLLN